MSCRRGIRHECLGQRDCQADRVGRGEGETALSALGGTDRQLPLISIVTPSYNQGQFLPYALDSILDQGYPHLEYVVIDGGSDDASPEIIKGREDRLTYWVSEKDEGQYDAINKGFSYTTGEIMGWLNSDDMYMPKALWVVGAVFARLPRVEWLTTQFPLTWNESGAARECRYVRGYGSQALLRGAYLTGGSWHATGVVQQESTFWRRSLWERAGGYVDERMRYAADFDLWARFAKLTDIYAVAAPLGGFRCHDAQKTAKNGVERYFEEAHELLLARGGQPYGRFGTMARRVYCRLFDQRPIPEIVPGLGRLLVRHGLAYEARTCVWEDSEWRVRLEILV